MKKILSGVKKAILMLVMLVIAFIVYNCIINTQIQVTEYELDEGFVSPVRIVQLTDLHNRVFGKDNQMLIKKVLNQEPDFVVMTGDMINEDEEDLNTIISLVKSLSENVPVYFSIGNHELAYERQFEHDITADLEDAGAVVLNYEYRDIEINGNEIRIGGYYGFYGTSHMNTSDKDKREVMNEFSESFENTERYKLLLCHIPTSWLDWNRIHVYPIDLVLCGHYHGGQVRIPFVGGLYAPYVGWFPEYTKGLFIGQTAKCILSTGLGAENSIPRINNPPEIVAIDLK